MHAGTRHMRIYSLQLTLQGRGIREAISSVHVYAALALHDLEAQLLGTAVALYLEYTGVSESLAPDTGSGADAGAAGLQKTPRSTRCPATCDSVSS